VARMSATVLMVVRAKYPYGFGTSENEAEKYPLWLRLTPEAKNHPFFLTPICLGSGTGAEYKKQPGPKALTALVCGVFH